LTGRAASPGGLRGPGALSRPGAGPASRSAGSPPAGRPGGASAGAALVVALLMLCAVLALGAAAARIALQGERAARNDRDHQVALMAAEAALLDAELDIEQSPDPSRSRSAVFSKDDDSAFPPAAAGSAAGEACGSAAHGHAFGLCRPPAGGRPAWLAVDFSDDGPAARAVPLGHFTGRHHPSGGGHLAARPPRYVIELLTWRRAGGAADRPTHFFRITAVGFGAHASTQVVLQSFYRKED